MKHKAVVINIIIPAGNFSRFIDRWFAYKTGDPAKGLPALYNFYKELYGYRRKQ